LALPSSHPLPAQRLEQGLEQRLEVADFGPQVLQFDELLIQSMVLLELRELQVEMGQPLLSLAQQQEQQQEQQ
jgi:hypothetical protein